MRFFKFMFISLFFSFILSGQDTSLLSVDRIYGSNEFRLKRYGPTQWLKQGNAFTALEKDPLTHKYSLVEYSSENYKSNIIVTSDQLIPDGKKYPLKIEEYSWNSQEDKLLIFTNSSRVWRANTKGDYWIYDLKSRELRQIGQTLPSSSLMFAKFNPQGDKLAYVSGFNLFVEDLAKDETIQLTYDGNGKIINGTFDWVYEEEFSCRDGFRWSPDGEEIAFWQLDASETREFYMINNTDSTYSQIIPVQYPKVGEQPSACRIGIVSLDGKKRWLDIPGEPTKNYLPRMQWLAKGKLLVQQINRKQNQYRIFLFDHDERVNIYEEASDTWIDIDHPDITMRFVVTDLPLTADQKAILKTSEKDGWRHIYKISLLDGQEELLTPGDYDIARFYTASPTHLLVNASPENSTQRYLYGVSMDGSGAKKRLTPKAFTGINKYNIAPNAKFAIHEHSSITEPPSIRLISLPDHKTIKILEDNQEYVDKMQTIVQPKVEFFQIEIEEGVVMDGRLYKPVGFNNSNKYPVVFHVYGEPWGQTATDSWSSLYNILLAQQGYCVINIDNRGTPCLKGTEWRKSIYRKIGTLNASDQAKAAEQILKWDFIDSQRVSVWGWSGGGSMTLNLMFQYPEIYKTGISVAPVAWQLYYDNVYQERYMGLPQENMEDFVKGSPLTYAHRLEGNLLLIHGTADDNVHYQNTEALVNELIKHNKMFSMMSYPNRSHSISEGANTRRHLYTMMNQYLLRNCPSNPLPKNKVRP